MGNVYMEASQINYRGGSKKMSVEEAIKAAGTEITPEEKTWIDSIPTLTTGKADNDVIAPEFDSEAGVYAIGDLVMNEGKLYEFTAAHETPGEWDPTEVSEKTVSDEIDTLKSGLTSKLECVTITIDDVEFPAGRSGDLYADLPSQYASKTIVSAFAYSLSKAIKPYVSYVDNGNKRVQYYTENSESSALTRSVTVTFLIV